MGFKIAIDGPSASGKSTIAKILASKLKFVHVDSGQMFRAITVLALNLKINLVNEQEYSFLNNLTLSFKNNSIFANGTDLTNDTHTPEIDKNVSLVSSFKCVREFVLNTLTHTIANENVVMDGRDIGTVVMPDADLKVFLTASVETRAKRRFLENQMKNIHTPLKEIEKDLRARDFKDTNRKIAPLKQAADAVFLDTSDLTIVEVANQIESLYKEKIKNEQEFTRLSSRL